MEQDDIKIQSQPTEQQPTTPAFQEKKQRRKWEKKTIKWLQIVLDYNLFHYGSKGEVLK